MTQQTQVQVPVVTSLLFGLLGGLSRRGTAVLAGVSMAVALSAHTLRVHLGVQKQVRTRLVL